ncbi:MAG: hypothetical protein LBT59_18950, partial [Clostridiales bacterium]|nr:hypothetical protein [Clostridiales bacterium]
MKKLMKKRIIGFAISFIIILGSFAPFPMSFAAAGSDLVQITKRNKAVTERYTVLVLDTSESMLGEPLKQMKD